MKKGRMVYMENIINKLQRFNKTIDNEIEYELNFIDKIGIFLDFLPEYLFHGTMLLDYTQYKFYDKKKKDRRKYVVFGRLLEIMKVCNNPQNRYIFDNKVEFNKKFNKYINREWVNVSEVTLDKFKDFIDKKKCIFIKEPLGMFGKGVDKINCDEIDNIEELFNEYQKNKILCEETLSQCQEMKDFNDTSLNTIRVVTMVDKNQKPHVIGALLRLGRNGKVADNFHHNGIAAYIDPEYGIVSSMGYDKNKTWHVVHPDSLKKIVGFEVPCWDKIVETVENAALIMPDMRYIGWDIAITEDYNIELIEGNPGADPDAEQITTHQGRWDLYKKYF
ncbi:MAG: sugar-transfer associated ATP-grasp domain-containing protein [Finegoldia magna]|nr:sugar-transfer associated ATP-grasp domain-containing protein [Finegoldia magna]